MACPPHGVVPSLAVVPLDGKAGEATVETNSFQFFQIEGSPKMASSQCCVEREGPKLKRRFEPKEKGKETSPKVEGSISPHFSEDSIRGHECDIIFHSEKR